MGINSLHPQFGTVCDYSSVGDKLPIPTTTYKEQLIRSPETVELVKFMTGDIKLGRQISEFRGYSESSHP